MFKNILAILSVILFFGGVVALSINTLGNFIYFIYLWGSIGLTAGIAAWAAIKLWLTVGLYSLMSIIIGYIGVRYLDE